MRGNRSLDINYFIVLPDKQSIEIGWNNLERFTANTNILIITLLHEQEVIFFIARRQRKNILQFS